MESELALGKAQYAERDQKVLETAFPIHTLNYWGDLNHPDSPYAFSLNVARFGELLKDVFEMTPADVRRIDLHVVGEGRLSVPRSVRERIMPSSKKRVIGRRVFVGATSTQKEEEIPHRIPLDKRTIDASLYLFSFWHFFKTERKFILSYVKTKSKEKKHQNLLGKDMRVFSITDEMLEFLEKTPDVVDERLRDLAGIKLRRDILATLIHEGGSHFFHESKDTLDHEEEEKRKLLANILGLEYTPDNFMERFSRNPIVAKFMGNIPKQMPRNYVFEEFAERAENFLAADPRWKDLITFEVNPNWPFNKNTSTKDSPSSSN